jgi:hypothetical protein
MPTFVDGLQHEIAAGVTAGMAIDEIDDQLIAPAPLPEDQQAALWLYGWALERLADRGQLDAELPGDARPSP